MRADRAVPWIGLALLAIVLAGVGALTFGPARGSSWP